MSKQYTAGDLAKMIRTRYSDERAYIVMENVADGTGAAVSGRIDAVVIALWPSRGLTRSAFEIKISRSDFLSELKKPTKNAWARECFHEFWYVAPDDVIKEQELPEGCGWLKPRGNGLSIVRHAARKDNPEFDDFLLASLCRSMQQELWRKKAEMRKEILKTDHCYQRALAHERAVEIFVRERTGYIVFEDNKDEILKQLRAATISDAIEKERDQVLTYLGGFQDRIMKLMKVFMVISHVGLIERDELGQLIVDRWGGKDTASIAMRRMKKDKKHPENKQIVEIFDFIKEYVMSIPNSKAE